MGWSHFKDVKIGVKAYFAARPLEGKTVVDIPAGKGSMTRFLQERGATVKALDLFTQGTQIGDVTIEPADLMSPLPLDDHSVDYVLFQEGIEHLPNQLLCLQEFHRVLKQDGTLLVTTPNLSNLRARCSFLCVESNSLRHLPANEMDDVIKTDSESLCFHHLFLIGIQKLRALGRVSGFKIRKLYPTRLSGSSLLLFLPLYPLLVLTSIPAYLKTLRRGKRKHQGAEAQHAAVAGEILRINLSPSVLLSNHLFVEFVKD